MRWFLRAMAFYRPEWPRIIVLAFLAVGSAAAGLLKPWPLALLVDSLVGNQPFPEWLGRRMTGAPPHILVAGAAGALLVLHLVHAGLAAAQNGLAIATGLRGVTRVRRAVYGWLLNLSMGRLQGTQAGDLVYRATWDVFAFQTLFNQGVCTQAAAIVNVASMTWLMCQLEPRLAAVALATAPVLVAAMRLWGPLLSRRATEAQTADAAAAAYVQQTVAHLPIVQSNTAEDREAMAFAGAVSCAERLRWRQHRSEVAYLAVVAGVFAAGTAAVVWIGGGLAVSGKITAGHLLVFVAYLAQWHEPLSQLSNAGAAVTGAAAGVRRVFEILDEPGAGPDGREAPRATGGDGRPSPPEIRFEGVVFSYDGRRRVLDGASLDVAAGESAAIIGPSGAGKTTLLLMIPKLLEPASGVVRWDGRDLRDFSRRKVRESVALVPQEPVLLPGTIAENIAYARPGASRGEIEAAARSAHAEEFIRRLPDGYETRMGDGAARLSVGERQRLSLARAFLKDAPVLLLDEPTSALDAESEMLVVESLRRLMQGRTTVMVAHRLATLNAASRIGALVEGKFVETGTAAELLARGGYYAKVRGPS
jgi:ATP-binding cassette, subfamily B, bacterial